MPANVAESFEDVDLVAFLAVPLVCVFRLSASGRKRVTEVRVPAHPAGEPKGGNHGHGHGHGKREADVGVRTQSEVEMLEDDAGSRAVMEQPHAVETALYAIMEPRNMGLVNAHEGSFFLLDRAPCLGRSQALLLDKVRLTLTLTLT